MLLNLHEWASHIENSYCIIHTHAHTHIHINECIKLLNVLSLAVFLKCREATRNSNMFLRVCFKEGLLYILRIVIASYLFIFFYKDTIKFEHPFTIDLYIS